MSEKKSQSSKSKTNMLDIKFNRMEKCYHPGELVQGSVVVINNSSSSLLKFNSIKLKIEGNVNLQLSARSIGLLEAFYSSLKPISLINFTLDVSNSGKCKMGTTEYPFEFKLKPSMLNIPLYDTYHGVYVNIQYTISAEMERGMLTKNLLVNREFYVKNRSNNDAINDEAYNKKFEFIFGKVPSYFSCSLNFPAARHYNNIFVVDFF